MRCFIWFLKMLGVIIKLVLVVLEGFIIWIVWYIKMGILIGVFCLIYFFFLIDVIIFWWLEVFVFVFIFCFEWLLKNRNMFIKVINKKKIEVIVNYGECFCGLWWLVGVCVIYFFLIFKVFLLYYFFWNNIFFLRIFIG